MTTIIIKEENSTLNDEILKELGYILKWNVWTKKVEMTWIREEIERLRVLKIPNVEIVLD
ncbi:MAG: hypothetical protein WA130_22235 [Candidatus Methanoperedens sp.]